MKNTFVTRNGRSFFRNGKPLRFIGANMYELANVDAATSEAMLRDCASEGFSAVRFWAFSPMTDSKLLELCDTASGLDLLLVPVLSDPPGYLQDFKISDQWYHGDFKKYFLGYAANLAHEFRSRNEILMWEIINEPSCDSFSAFYEFVKCMSEAIRDSDSNHMISVGTVGGVGDRFGNFASRFSLRNFELIYSLRCLDAVSVHDYSFDANLLERLDLFFRLKGRESAAGIFSAAEKAFNYLPDMIDKVTLKNSGRTYDLPFTLRSIWKKFIRHNFEIAARLGKPLYVGEIGVKKDHGVLRRNVLRSELNDLLSLGAAAAFLWSFEARGKSLDGHDYGFGTDDGFGAVVSELNNMLMSDRKDDNSNV